MFIEWNELIVVALSFGMLLFFIHRQRSKPKRYCFSYSRVGDLGINYDFFDARTDKEALEECRKVWGFVFSEDRRCIWHLMQVQASNDSYP
jgi:hypothetical protein